LEQQQLAAFFGGIFTVIEVLIFAPIILAAWMTGMGMIIMTAMLLWSLFNNK
jgi:hypothetical protein